MWSELGKLVTCSVFGESHGSAVGAVLGGLPAGEPVDLVELARFMARRRPGGDLTTQRQEEDEVQILSGLYRGKTAGTPLCLLIENRDAHSGDYAAMENTPRPAHADYTAFVKWNGAGDMRGGGHFSGRLTAPLCAAGGIAKQILARRGIFIGAHLLWVGAVKDAAFPLTPDAALLNRAGENAFPTLDEAAGQEMAACIARARTEGDSVGGVIECAAIGLPVGLGGPLFDGAEGRLSAALFGIPGAKGVSFGSGFACADMPGSLHNDPFKLDEGGRVVTETNHSGGLQGGITNGMPLVFHLAMKPTPSIAKPQRSVDLARREETIITVAGRHDPCIALRAVPVAEAVGALVLLDLLLEGRAYGIG